MRLLNFLFVVCSLFLLACSDDSSSANDSQKGSGAVGGACKGDAYASEIDRNQNTITLHHIKYRTECDVQGPVPTFASVGIAQDLVYDYQFVGDTLIIKARGDGFKEIVMVGGKNGNPLARWKVLSGYNFVDGAIVKDEEREEDSSNDYFNIAENCMSIEDGTYDSWDYTETQMVAWIYDELFSHYKFDHLSNAYGDYLFTKGGDHVASDIELYGISVLEKTKTSETISAYNQTVSIRFSDIVRDSRDNIYSSYKATVEANGSTCSYEYLYASSVPEEFCKIEYRNSMEVNNGKAVRINNDDTESFAKCLTELLP